MHKIAILLAELGKSHNYALYETATIPKDVSQLKNLQIISPTKLFLHFISFFTCLHMTVTNIVQFAELSLELYEVCGCEMMKLFTALVSQREEGCQKGCLGVCV